MNNSDKPKFPPNQLLSEGAVRMTTTAVSKTKPFRIMSNGHEYKIQKKCFTLFFKKEYWVDLRKPIGDLYDMGFCPTYYNTLSEAKVDLDKFVEHDSKLTEWKEVVV